MQTALNIKPPVLRLSAVSMLIMLLTGTAFLFMRYYKLTGQGATFAYSFEIGRMLVNFGGMALLSPLIYRLTALAYRINRFRWPLLLLGLIAFAFLYLVLNKLTLYFISDNSTTFNLWTGANKLFLNFSHILVLFYVASVYGSWLLLKPKADKKSVKTFAHSVRIMVDGLEQNLDLVSTEYVLTFDHYLKIYRQGRFDLVRMTLSQFINQLPEQYLRIHRSTVVNTHFINKVIKKQGKLFVIMQDGEQLKVSASYEQAVLDLQCES